MKENKNIERLFQEKFKDFEVSPPNFIWENIQEKLHPIEKKRRVIPFWFKTVGIAASFVGVIFIVFFNTDTSFKNTNSNNKNNPVVNSEKNTNTNQNNPSIRTNKFNTSDYNTNLNTSKSSSIEEGKSQSKSNSQVNSSTINKISNLKTDSEFNSATLHKVTAYKSNTGFVSNHKKQSNIITFKKNKTQFKSSNFGIVLNRSNKNKLKSNATFNDFDVSQNNIKYDEKSNVNTNNRFNISKDIDLNSGVTDVNSSNSLTRSKNNEVNSTLIENSIPFSTAIATVEEVKIDTITLATVTIEENLLEKILREKETKKVADEKDKWNKWAVNSYVSPVFFNSFASGSPISDEFATNEKTFNNSTSYGIGVAYHINKRFSIKTGVSNLNLDYDTENIAFYSTFEDQSKIANTNIERNTNGKYLVIKHEKYVSKNAFENQVIDSNQNLGNLNQKTQYIEVPVEMSYAILNKKFGVAIKGGMSTLFLTENVISISGNDGNMQIGKASNLNNVHFSSNIGLGLSYSFMKNFQLNVDPILKYQINTFNKNSEDFTPYVIGINTGISYKF